MIFCFLFDSIISKFKTSKVKLFNIIPNIVYYGRKINPNTNLKKRTYQSVLITGGSGLVGRYLTSLLFVKGYTKYRTFQEKPINLAK